MSAVLLAVHGLVVQATRPAAGPTSGQVGARAAPTAARGARLVDGVSFEIQAGGSLALLGESGAGKSLTALALAGLLPPGVEQRGGTIAIEGRDVAACSAAELAALRGRHIAYVFQDPAAALHPLIPIGEQIAEGARAAGQSRSAAAARARELAREVGLGEPERLFRRQPHELSGGMRQRALVALALAGDPRLLVADEPTSNLDPPRAAQVLELLARLRAARGLALLLVTHHLDAARALCERALVLERGRVIESGSAREVLDAPRHPHTRALVTALPRLGPEPAGVPGRRA